MSVPQPTKEVENDRDTQPVRRPAVDVWEDASAVYVIAELPGVSKDHLTLHVEKNELNLVGRANSAIPEGCTQTAAEYNTGSFQRTFRLSDDIDAENILGTVVRYGKGEGFMGVDLVDVEYVESRTGETHIMPFGLYNLESADPAHLTELAERWEHMAAEMREWATRGRLEKKKQ